MELKDFLKGKDRAEFARRIGTTKGYLDLLACKARRASPELALQIERESAGQVTLRELLFPNEQRKSA